jgi:hypothetical protein
LHVHIVAPVPVEILKKAPELESFRLADYFRRANLLSEMISVFEGYPIKMNQSGTAIFFGYLQPGDLKIVQRFFREAAQGRTPAPLSDQIKIGWIGFRGSDKYDQPGLYGFEYRAVGEDTRPQFVKAVLNGLQYGMVKNELGISRADMQRWQDEHQGLGIEALWYHQNGTLVRQGGHLPPEVQAQFSKAKVSAGLKGDDAVRMLAYNWSEDPIVWGNTALADRIREAQGEAIQAIASGLAPNDAIRVFLAESGLLEATAGSLGMPQVAQSLKLRERRS